VGLLRAGDAVVAAPARVPRVLADFGDRQQEVELGCDTAFIDTDRALLALVYRGSLFVESEVATRIERLVVVEAEPGAPIDWRAVGRRLQRGRFTFAVEPEDLDGRRAPSPDDAEELRMARFATWGGDAPEPALPLAEFAAISAALAEKPDGRKDVLARRELDEDVWAVEERAWLERMAAEAEQGDGSLADDFGQRFVAEQERLASPEEAARTVDDYAEIAVAIERAGDPGKALGPRGLTLAAWMRLDRRMQREAEASPAAAAHLEERLAAARAAAGPLPDDEETDP
jgi:hypothetical protein